MKNSIGNVCAEIEPQPCYYNLTLHCLPQHMSLARGTYDLIAHEKFCIKSYNFHSHFPVRATLEFLL